MVDVQASAGGGVWVSQAWGIEGGEVSQLQGGSGKVVLEEIEKGEWEGIGRMGKGEPGLVLGLVSAGGDEGVVV